MKISFIKKKSQAALEFLTTYAWAFLVLLILIGALGYFGILSPSKLLPERCSFGAEIGCTDYVIATNGVQLRLKNNAGKPIIVDAIKVSNEKAELTCISSIVNQVWNPEEIKDVPIVCDFTGAGLVQGNKEKLNIQLKYYDVGSGTAFTRAVQGEVFAVAGSGAVPGGGSIVLGTSCKDILDNGYSGGNGLYTIDPDGSGPITSFQVYCDMATDGGGWTLVVRALAGSQAHNVGTAYGTLSSPTQGTVAKLSNTIIINIGKPVNNVYETRFLFDLFADRRYYQWNNGYAADFSNQIPTSVNPFEQTRKNSYSGTWTNDLVTYSAGCGGGYSPFSSNSICYALWAYSTGNSCHSGFGLSADCSKPWGGTENTWHRSGTMWVR